MIKPLDIQNWGIQRRVMVLAMVPLVTISTLLGTYMISERVKTAYQQLEERGRLLVEHLAPASEFPLFAGNMEVLRSLAAGIAREPDVVSVQILDESREVILTVNQDTEVEAGDGDDDNFMEFEQPIGVSTVSVVDVVEEDTLQNLEVPAAEAPRNLGWAVVRISTARLKSRETEIIINGILLIGVGLFLSAFLALRIGESVVEPMLRLVETVMRLRNGELDARVEVRSGGEIGLLEEWINAMAFRMQAAQQALQYKVNDATRELRQTVKILEERNADLEAARKEALKAGKVKSDFLANMSHEIRTPLNAVVGYTRLLQETSLTREQRDYTRTISQSASLLVSVIDDILNFERLESGNLQLEKISFDLHSSLEDTICMLSPAAHDKKLEIALLIHSEVPQMVYGDPVRINQIATNFINNAIKFTSDGGITMQVSVDHDEEERTWIRLAVSDTGIGMTDEEKANLYKPFSQADSSISRRFGGTGLGLSICKRLVELMGGEIGVESERGVGSTFWVIIPVEVDRSFSSVETGALAGRKLLVCEANPYTRRAVRNTLLRLNASVYTTGSISRLPKMLEAEAANGEAYDLLVVGLSPQHSTVEHIDRTYDRLRKYYDGELLILVSSHGGEQALHADRDARCQVLSKPVRRDRLLLTIKGLLGEADELVSEEKAGEIAALSAGFRHLRVLAAEDNAFNRSLVEAYMHKLGVSVDMVENGAEAVAAARENEYDIIFLDIHMPVLDGVQAAEQIHALEASAQVPIIAMTADVFVHNTEKTGTRDFADFVYKPIKIEDLVSVIFRHTGSDAVFDAPRGVEESATIRDTAEVNAVSKKDSACPVAADPDGGDGGRSADTMGSTASDIPPHLVDKLYDELPVQRDNLVEALMAEDIPLMREHAHQLYGLCGYFGIDTLAGATRELQTALHEGDFDAIRARMLAVEQAIDTLLEGRKVPG